MKIKTKLREAHKCESTNSICSILWSSNGEQIVTACSSDDSIYIHDAVVPSNAPKVLRNHLDGVTSLALSPNSTCLASGSVDHSVKLYKFPSGDFETTITRFTLPIRTLAFNKSGSLLAAAGDDEGVKFVKTVDGSIAKILKGHRGPVTSVDFDPKNEYFASLDTFGTVIIWELESGRIVHELDSIAPNHGSCVSTMNILAWSPDGNLLAVPGLRNDVVMYDRDTAEKDYALRGDHLQPVCFLSWSPNGKYMATSSLDRQILIWDVGKKQDIERQKFAECISGMAWKPEGNALAVIDVTGKFGTWESAVPSTMKSPTEDVPGVQSRSSNAFLSLDNKEDEPSASGSFSDLNDEDLFDELEPRSRKRLRKKSKYEEEWEEDNEDLLYDIPKVGSRKKPSHGHKVKTSGKNELLNMTVSSGTKMQEPFQPGVTPVQPGKRNFLCYNMLGSITTMQHDGYSHIEIDFHDTNSGPRVPAMTDYFGFTMATLNENGSVFANPCKGEKNMSTLMYRPFSTWANNSEWSMRFEGEEVRAIALGSDWVAAVTSLNFCRIFTAGGLQQDVFSLDGPVVTAVGFKDELVIVAHASPSLPSDEQMLKFRVFNVPRGEILTGGRVPLTPGSCLKWFGFSEEGQLSSFDSKGVLRVFTNRFGGRWRPLFSASKLKKPEESYWVAGLNANKLFCIVCKSPETFPQATPKPVLTLLDLSFPLASSDLGADDLENEFITINMHLFQIQRRIEEREAAGFEATSLEDEAFNLEVSLDRCILRLIASCCNGDKLVRATELVKLLSLEKSVRGAIKLATALKLTNLADRFNEILEEKLRREKERNNPVPTPNSSNYVNNAKADVASASTSNKSSNTQETIRTPVSLQVPAPVPAFSPTSFTRKRNSEELTKEGSGKTERVYTAAKAMKTNEVKAAGKSKEVKESNGDNKKAKEVDQLTPSRPSNSFAKPSNDQGGGTSSMPSNPFAKPSSDQGEGTPSRPSNPFAKPSSDQGGRIKSIFDSVKKMKKKN